MEKATIDSWQYSIMASMDESTKFLPINLDEARKRGWEELDIVIISGDAYVDHPSFGAAVIGRVLENAGYRVGIIPQPRVNCPNDFLALGKPRLFFGIAAGNVDSMLVHYTALKRVRNDDPYSPGGKATRKPKRAVISYTSAVKHACSGVPVVIGGIEASTRRFTHFDYWDNKLRRSILLDSKADLLVYGMGEMPVLDIASALSNGRRISELTNIPGTVYRSKEMPELCTRLPSYEECKNSIRKFCTHFNKIENNWETKIAEKSGEWWVIQNPPHELMTTEQLDKVFELPFTRLAHPSYAREGGIPALKTVETSITSHRGCLANCSFCSISIHQGRQLVNRSISSIKREVDRLVKTKGFRGTVSDVGGPSANMYTMKCKIGGCKKRNCVEREICPHLDIDHDEYLRLLNTVLRCRGVKHVFVGSGIRYDLLLAQKDEVMEEIFSKFVGGQLKVAPEHASQRVLRYMNKPPWEKYLKFKRKFYAIAKKLGLKRYLIPYLITSHPGATLRDEKLLLAELEKDGFVPDQVQDFIPLPMTRAAVMFYTGIDPVTNDSVPVARLREEKEKHFAILRPKVEKYRRLRKKLLGNTEKSGGSSVERREGDRKQFARPMKRKRRRK